MCSGTKKAVINSDNTVFVLFEQHSYYPDCHSLTQTLLVLLSQANSPNCLLTLPLSVAVSLPLFLLSLCEVNAFRVITSTPDPAQLPARQDTENLSQVQSKQIYLQERASDAPIEDGRKMEE